MADLVPVIKQRFCDDNNDPLVGGKLYSYIASTSTPKVTYQDYAGTPNTNPIILDANGECNLRIATGFYKFILKDANDVTIWTVDKVSLPVISGNGLPVGGTTGQSLVKSSNDDNEVEWKTLDKDDVGLDQVDNTSDDTKNAATATLTNKTFGNKTVFNAQIVGAIADDATAGTIETLDAPTTTVVRLTGALNAIAGIEAVAYAQFLVLINASGSDEVIKNESLDATAADRILTGTDADIGFKDKASIWLVRDVTSDRWRVVGGSGSGGGRTVVNYADVEDDGTIGGMDEAGDYSIYVKGDGGPIKLNNALPLDTGNLEAGNRVTVICTSNDDTIEFDPDGSGLIIGFHAVLGLAQSITFEWTGTKLYPVATGNM